MAALKLLLLCVMIVQGSSKELHGNENTAPDVQDASLYNTDTIAFSAELSSETEVAGDSTIIFDRVITNAGGLYFGNSGQFACPDEGLYVFTWGSRKASVADLEGMRCIQKLSSGGADVKYGPKTNYYATITSGVAEMTAIVKCTTSPPTAVTVMSVPWSYDVGKTAVFMDLYTSFSGFRLQEQIAFAAELFNDQYLFQGSKIRFDKVLSNYGGHYDPIGHDFTCPDDGVYVFSVSTHTNDPTTPWSVSRVMMQGEVVMQGPITYIATESYDSGSASTTAVLQCTEGFSVYVEAQAAHDFPHNSYGAELTSFSGFKLYDVPGAVAFTAVMTNNQTIDYENQPFIFDEIITNIGNAYDVVFNQFTCPDDDYYLFTWTAAANYGGGDSNTHLLMDTIGIKSLYLTQKTIYDINGTSGSSSMSIIQQCSTSSRLQVVGQAAHERVFLGGYTSFSGYKIPGA